MAATTPSVTDRDHPGAAQPELVVAVAGATGRAGGATVEALRQRGVRVVPIARSLDPDPHLDGTLTEVAGPRGERLVDAVRLLVDRGVWSGEVVEVDDPSDPRRVFEAGGLLPGPGVPRRGPTFAEWVEATYPRA